MGSVIAYPLRAVLVVAGMALLLLCLHYGVVRAGIIPETIWIMPLPNPNGSVWINVNLVFWPLALLFLGVGLLFFWAVRVLRTPRGILWGLGAGMLLRLALLPGAPGFSDDYYRFLWDGAQVRAGQNPYAFRPADMPQPTDPKLGRVYARLNSETYYTVYPPVLQAIFATAPADSRYGAWVLRLFIILAEGLSVLLLVKLCRAWNLPPYAPLLYALNPFVIFELSGNIHFEAWMTLGVLACLWLLHTGRVVPAALALTLAAGVKLLPLLMVPFVLLHLGWRRGLVFAGVMGVAGALLALPVLLPGHGPHFLESVGLYFRHFEFNGGLYLGMKALLGPDHAWKLGHILPWLVNVGVLLLALRAYWRQRQGHALTGPVLAAYMLAALTLYQLLATTVHPWYLTPLAALAVLTPYRFPFLWSLFAALSYGAYYHQNELPAWFLWVETGSLLLMLAWEFGLVRTGDTLESWVLRQKPLRALIRRSIPARVGIKLERVLRHIQPGETVLDIGTGNGGLALALRQRGVHLRTVDVKDISFFEEVRPEVYDGQRLPCDDKSQDVSLLITVLHHTPDPDAILREAMRVTRRRIVIMEDIYRNPVQRQLTFFMDSLVNLEFHGHPHTNRDAAGWKETFSRMGLKAVYEEEFTTLLLFRQVVYVVEVPEVAGSAQRVQV